MLSYNYGAGHFPALSLLSDALRLIFCLPHGAMWRLSWERPLSSTVASHPKQLNRMLPDPEYQLF
jgi:hypothetical protein